MYSRVVRSQMERTIASCLLVGGVFVILAMPALAQRQFAPSLVEKGVLLVASPSLDDPNFHQTVLLIVEHGRGGTVGLILNRPTDVLLREVLPDFPVLKGTTHRLFTGGPVERTQMVLLFRLQEPYPDTRLILKGIYVGIPSVLERIITQSKPTETFRAFTGFAGWAPGQLEQEMLEGAWGVLPSDTFNIFDKDPATFWPDSVARLQAPKVISDERQTRGSVHKHVLSEMPRNN
jgi:putative transcriptional regulator